MKKMKKLLAFIVALTMIMGMATTVFAAEGDKKLTINTAAGHTYEIYQMLKGDVSELDKGAGTLANVTAGANLSGTVEAFEAAIKGKTGTDLSAAASALTTGTPTRVTGDGTAKDITVAPGYYVVKDSYTYTNENEKIEEGQQHTTAVAYMVAVVGDTTMNPKMSTPDIKKEITDTDANKALDDAKTIDTAAIGDKIEYQSTSTVPITEGYKYYYYVVNDTMSTGLTYNKDLAIKIGSGETAVTLVKNTDYTITETDQGFELVINDMKNLSETRKLVGKPITITYSATVNENAEIGTNPNTNTIKLTYSNNPSDTFNKEPNGDHKPQPGDAVGVTPEKITETYVTELTIVKVDEKHAVLDGAEFTLTGANLKKVKVTTETEFVKVGDDETGEYYKLTDGTYTKVAPTETEEGYNADKYESTTPEYNLVVTPSTSAEEVPTTGVVAVLKNGYFTITGLNAGDYTLTETKTPTGYNNIAPITFKVEFNATDKVFTTPTGSKITVKADNTLYAEIENKKGVELPSTGGMGTRLFYIFGAAMVLFAGILLVAKRRMNRA